MSRSAMSARLLLVCLLVPAFCFCALAADGAGEPLSVFVVHCEPTNATEPMFLQLVDLVALANEFAIPLTIDFTAQWAEMILEDESKIAAVSAWMETGHEIGAHHHAYWATLERSANWDGYTNTPVSDLLPIYQDRFLGTMEDYMALLDALPGERVTACMGQDDERDMEDWPASLSYSTTGNFLEDCVSEPTLVSFPSGDAWHVSHGLILQTPGALTALYEATAPDRVFGVVGHVYNFRDEPRAFEVWFRYLSVNDPSGARRRTVASAIEEWLEDDG